MGNALVNAFRARFIKTTNTTRTVEVVKPKGDTEWVNESANVEYERYLMDAYDASLIPNPCVD